MPEGSVTVSRLRILRAPGFEVEGFRVPDLDPGVNLIHGPNAVGKTTMARALQTLLWPESRQSSVRLFGEVSVGAQSWRVEIEPDRARFQRDGQEAERPSLPPSDQRDRYRLSLHDLLQHETDDASLADAIQREWSGGYDLGAAVEELGFDDSPSTRGLKVVRSAEAAIEDWKEAQRSVQELRDEQRRLPALQDDLEEAGRARDRVDLLRQAIEYAEAREELEDARARHEAFPAEVSKLDGSEADDVQELEERITGERETLESAAEAKNEAEEELEEADLPAEGLPDGLISELKDRRDTLSELEDRRREQKRELERARERREEAIGDIPIDVESEDLETLEPVAWGEFEDFARGAISVYGEREAYDAYDRWLAGEEEFENDLSTLRRARRALEDWLQAGAPPDPKREERALIGPAVFGLGGSAAAGALGTAVGWWVGGLVLLLTVVGLVAWYRFVLRDRGGGEDRERHREEFERLDLELPAAWEVEAVRQRLDTIYEAISEQILARERSERLDAVQEDLGDIEERERELKDRRAALQDRFGLAPDIDDIELFVLTQAVCRWQKAHDDVSGARAAIESAEEQIDEAKASINEELEPYSLGPVSDSSEATRSIRALEERQTKHVEATRKLEEATERIENAEEEIERLREERKAVFEDAGLEEGEEDRLRELCEQVEDFEGAQREKQEAAKIAEREEEKLEEYPGFEEDLKDQAVAELQRARRDAEETAGDFGSVQKRITEIETKIDEAKADHKVEETATEKARKLDALAAELESDKLAMVGDLLARRLREETVEANRPPVMKRARELLATITRGRYRLDLEQRTGDFRAHDSVKERGFNLDELSSGTRLQLLLAVRMAFIEKQETGPQLPLLMDETLANTDDHKAGIVIDTALQLARNGRQVFYFSAQGDEIAKWLGRLQSEDGSDLSYNLVDLAEVQEAEDQLTVPEFTDLRVESPAPPDPDGHDHASYGEALEVDPFDPRKGAGSAHLWYLVEEVNRLHQLLRVGVERWGQVRTLLNSGRVALFGDDEEDAEALRLGGIALEEFVEAWKVGRGRRVDRQALTESGAVTGNFIDEVTELAEELDGDGERLVQALLDGQVSRFRSNKAEELDEFLRSEGYVDDAEALTPEEIRLRMVDELLRQGASDETAVSLAERILQLVNARAGAGSQN